MQTVNPLFNQLSKGDVRPHSYAAYISFEKAYDPGITWFTLNQSMLNGGDVLGTAEDNPLLPWSQYEYENFTERIINMSVERSLDFPYSTVSAIADFTLNNYDKYFTPHSTSPISSYILPKRPVRLLQGLANMVLPQFVGLTQGMPEIDDMGGTAAFTANDFITQIFGMAVRETTAMRDVRTDEILAEIFTQFGLLPEQYDLARGRNVVKYLFFEKDQVTAGDVIRPLMQAEMGMLWLDEQGIIKFRPRLEQPDTPVYLLDDDSIVTCETLGDAQIINKVIINTDVREVQPWTTVYSKKTTDTSLDVVPAGGTYVFKASLQDPLLNVVQPVFGQNAGVSWFTAALPGGAPVGSGINITSIELKTNSYEMTISNANAFDVNIDQMNIWAEPAKKISVEPIVYENKETDSIQKYDESADNTLEITTNFIQSISAARSLALTILDEYSEYADLIQIEAKGNAALQLGDIVEVDYKQYDGQYRIIGIKNQLQDGKFTQILTLRRYEPRDWFTLNQSVLNGGDVIAP